MSTPKKTATAKLGRKTKRTPEVEAKLFEALRLGCTRRAACAYAGIHAGTLCDWANDFPEFSEAITRAEDEAEAGFSIVIQRAAANEGDWKAAAWWLERRRKEDYSARQEVEHAGKDGGPIPVAFQFVPANVSPDTDSA